MPHTPESAFPEHPPSRFNYVNLTRVQEGTYLDLDDVDSSLELALLIKEHYNYDNDPVKRAELLRLRRFAMLAAQALSAQDQPLGVHDIYVGELLALDQGYRLTGAYIHPSDEIQKTAFSLLKTIPDHEKGVGTLDANREVIHLPKDAAFRQLERTKEWGSRLYAYASHPPYDNPDIKPLHETVDRLTDGFDEKRAEAIRAGFWLVMQHLIVPPQQPALIIEAEAAIAIAKADRRPGSEFGPLSTSALNELYPELANTPGTASDAYYESMTDAFSVLLVKFMRAKTLLAIHKPDEDVTVQQKKLEKGMERILSSEVNIPLGSSLEVGGDYFYITRDNNKKNTFFNQKQSHDQLRGDFDGIVVKKGYSQRAYVDYRNSGYHQTIADEYEPYIPYVRLKNAFTIDFESSAEASITTFEQPVEVPILYTDIHFSKLTDTTEYLED